MVVVLLSPTLRLLGVLDVHRDVERDCAGEAADADAFDAGFGDGADGLRVTPPLASNSTVVLCLARISTGSASSCSPCCPGRMMSTPQRRRRRGWVRSCSRESTSSSTKLRPLPSMSAVRRALSTAAVTQPGKVARRDAEDVVVLEEDGVVQTDAMAVAAAAADGVFRSASREWSCGCRGA